MSDSEMTDHGGGRAAVSFDDVVAGQAL